MYKVILLGDNDYEQSHVVTQITKVHQKKKVILLGDTEYEQSNVVTVEGGEFRQGVHRRRRRRRAAFARSDTHIYAK